MINVDEICLAVYRKRLDDMCAGDADRQAAKDNDGGAKQRVRAQIYRPVVFETLALAGLVERPVRKPPGKKKAVT
jgi:hypothetical protein